MNEAYEWDALEAISCVPAAKHEPAHVLGASWRTFAERANPHGVAAFNFRIDAALSLGLQFSLKRLQLSNMPLGLRRGRVEAVSERSARHRRLGGLSLR